MQVDGAETAVVIAAGAGSRMTRSSGNGEAPKPAALVLGVPVLVRVLRRLAEARVRRAVVVTGCRAAEIEATAQAGCPEGLEVTFVHNDAWERQNGLSVLTARHEVDGTPFFLTMADHLYSATLIDVLRAAWAPDVDLALAVDRRLGEIGDIDDAVRVRTGAGGRIAEIGKGLAAYDAVDTGVFLCTSALFHALALERDARGGDCSLSDGVRRIARLGRAQAVDILPDAWWQDIDTASDLVLAERKLRQHEASAWRAA